MIDLLIPVWLLWAAAFVPLGSFYALSRSGWVFKMALLRLVVLFFLLKFFASAAEPLGIIQILVVSQMIYLFAVIYSLKRLWQRDLTGMVL
jgi:hypothetical protein